MTPTRKSVPGAGSEAGEMMSLSEMNAVVHEAKDKILALLAERDVLLEAGRRMLALATRLSYVSDYEWNTAIDALSDAIAASSHDLRQEGRE